MSGQFFFRGNTCTGVFEIFSFDMGTSNLNKFGVVCHSGYKCN